MEADAEFLDKFRTRYKRSLGDVQASELDDGKLPTVSLDNELLQWADLNRALRHHGFPPINVIEPAQLGVPIGHCLFLHLESSLTARENLSSLLTDADHRHTLIQELRISNDTLQENYNKQVTLCDKYDRKNHDLRAMLDDSQMTLKDVEEERQRLRDHLEKEDDQLKSTNKTLEKDIKQVTAKCRRYEKQVDKLEKQLEDIKQQENKRQLRTNQVFQEFRKRTSRAHNVMDEKLLDVIDSYEQQLCELQKELEYYRYTRENNEDKDSGNRSPQPASKHYRDLIRSYTKQVRDDQLMIKNLEEQLEITKLEMQGRPELKDFRISQHRVKKLEKLLAGHEIGIPDENGLKPKHKGRQSYSTKVDDLDDLPLDFCRQYLKDISSEVDVSDLDKIVPAIDKIRNRQDHTASYQTFVHDIYKLVRSLDTSPKQDRRYNLKHHISEKTLHHLLAVLNNWRDDIANLHDLQLRLLDVSSRMCPWLDISLPEEAPVVDLINILDKMHVPEGRHDLKMTDGHPSPAVMDGIISHFQTLFDVESISGIYPRMNDVYTRLGEAHNVINTLRNLLGLPDHAKMAAIVDAVSRVCHAHNSTTTDQLKHLLQTDNIDSVARKLAEHSDFMPVFQEVTKKLMEILALQRIEQIIPAVRALKLLTS